MKAIKLNLLFLIYLNCSQTLLAENLTAEQVLQAVDNIRAPSDNFSFALDVEQKDSDDTRKFSFQVKVKDQQKSLVSYTKPLSSKGKRILMVGENLWIYIPNTRMPIRISAQQKVSAGVANADVARVVFSLDYNADKLTKESVDNQQQYHLSLTAKTKAAAYQRIELWTATNDLRPLKADFYTRTGRKLKTIFYKKYQQVLGKQRPMLLELFDGMNTEQKVFMHYRDMRLADTPDMYFQKSYLPRLQL